MHWGTCRRECCTFRFIFFLLMAHFPDSPIPVDFVCFVLFCFVCLGGGNMSRHCDLCANVQPRKTNFRVTLWLVMMYVLPYQVWLQRVQWGRRYCLCKMLRPHWPTNPLETLAKSMSGSQLFKKKEKRLECQRYWSYIVSFSVCWKRSLTLLRVD